MIKSQRSATKFLVDDAKDDSGNEGICTLVAKASGSLGANRNVYFRTSSRQNCGGVKIHYQTIQLELAETSPQLIDTSYTITDDSTVSYLHYPAQNSYLEELRGV